MQTNYQKEEIKEIMNNNGNKTTFLDFLKANKKKILLIILASFFFAFGSTSLLTKAATIQTGLSAISMTISLILPVTKPYLNFIYLLLNVPLIIIFWKKVKKQYIYSTLIFLLTNAIFGFFIGFNFGNLIDGKDVSLDSLITQNILIFCPPTNYYETLYAQEHGIKNIMTVNLKDYTAWFEQKMSDSGNVIEIISNKIENGKTLGVQKGWPIFVYTLASVGLLGVAGAISWKCGGSTGGTDIITYYYSTKKRKSIGSLTMIVGSIIVAASLIVIWSLSQFGPSNIKSNINGFESLFSLQTLSTSIYIVLYGKIVNTIYPKYEKQIIKIDTVNLELITNFLKQIHYNHPYKIHTLTSGRTGQPIYSIETVALLLETEDLIKKIKTIDPTAWVSKVDVKKIYGNFDYSSVE